MEESAKVTYDKILGMVEQIVGRRLSKEEKEGVFSIDIDEGRSVFGNIPSSLIEGLMNESFDSTMGMPIPAALGNAGKAIDTTNTHQFKTDNKCPYFQKKTELCGLDGRICLYDTETFPVCSRYKEGFTRGVPGLDGNKPTVPPINELPKDPAADLNLPSNSPIGKV